MKASQVVLFLIDGLRPDALSAECTPTLYQLMARGAHTLTARTVMPSCTLPCHMALFHAVPPERHGITSNTYTPPVRPIAGLFEVAKSAGLKTAAFYNWEELRDLWRPGSMHRSYYTRIGHGADEFAVSQADREVANAAKTWLEQGTAQFTFVYLGTVDEVGHRHGWMSDEYRAAAQRADKCIEDVIQALPNDCGIVVTSDHGGHGRSHGTDCAEDMTIPFIMAGPGVPPAVVISMPVNITDIAPTIAHWLGLSTPEAWEGKPIRF